MRNNLYLLLGTVAVLILDLVSKYFVVKITAPIYVLPFLKIFPVGNSAFVFGVPSPRLAIVGVSLAALVLLFYIFLRQTRREAFLTIFTFSLIFGGALGNLFERVWSGVVIDFITFWFIPNFNLADCALTLGIVLLILGQKKIFRKKSELHL